MSSRMRMGSYSDSHIARQAILKRWREYCENLMIEQDVEDSPPKEKIASNLTYSEVKLEQRIST